MKKRYLLKLFGIFTFLTLLLSFQNCGQQGSIFLSSSDSKSSSESISDDYSSTDNGVPYGGKISYHHYVPDFTCEQKSAPQSILQIGLEDAELTENRHQQCAAVTKAIDLKLIDRSPYHGNIVGLGSEIFELSDKKANAIPDDLVEAWCFAFDIIHQKRFEVIQKYDRVKQQAVGHIYYTDASGTTQKVTPFSVSRLVNASSVHYQTDSYDLVIDKNKPSSIGVGQYEGTLNISIANHRSPKTLSCRLGAYLDAWLWPAKVVIDQGVVNFTLLDKSHSLLAISQNSLSQKHLARLNLNNLSLEALTSPLPTNSMGVSNKLRVTPDESYAIFSFENGLALGASELMRFDLKTKNMIPLSPTLSGAYSNLAGVEDTFDISSDGTYAIYTDGSLDQNNNPDIRKSAFSVSLLTGIVKALNPPPTAPDTDVYSPQIIEGLNKVVYLRNYIFNGNQQIYTVDALDGKNLKSIFSSSLSKKFLPFNLDPLFKIIGHGKYVLFQVIELGKSFVYYAATDGSVSGSLGEIANIQAIATSANEELIAFNSNGNTFLVQIGTWQKKTLPLQMKNDMKFSDDSQYLIGTSQDANLGVRIWNVNSLTELVQCPLLANEKLISFTHGANGIIYGLTNSSSSQKISLWQISLNSGCLLKNSFPTSASIILGAELKLSNDFTKALVKVRTQETLFNSENLIFVPLNGMPSVKITFPTIVSAPTITDFKFDTDPQVILFSGSQIKEGEVQLFRWLAPDTSP